MFVGGTHDMNGVVFFQVGGEFGGAKFAAAVGVYLARVELGVGHESFVCEEEVRLLSGAKYLDFLKKKSDFFLRKSRHFAPLKSQTNTTK